MHLEVVQSVELGHGMAEGQARGGQDLIQAPISTKESGPWVRALVELKPEGWFEFLHGSTTSSRS